MILKSCEVQELSHTTCGHAMDVPERMEYVVSLSLYALTINSPCTNTSCTKVFFRMEDSSHICACVTQSRLPILTGAKIVIHFPKFENQLIVFAFVEDPTEITEVALDGE